MQRKMMRSRAGRIAMGYGKETGRRKGKQNSASVFKGDKEIER